MRIAMISTPFVSVPPRDYGGTELIVHELTEGLIARGHDVTLFATGDSETSAELKALYRRAVWPPDPLTELNHVAWALEAAAAGEYDILHIHSSVGLAVARLVPDIPLVYTLHHDRNEPLSAFYQYYPRTWFVAISADQRSREVPLPRFEVIHHGLDPARFDVKEQPEPYVAFIGRLAREKGPHTAIDVAARVGFEIRVAGRVHEVDQEFGEREVLPRLRLPHVRYLGSVGMVEKAPLLRSARALLAPLEWEEPFGVVLIEAMLSGCPVIAYPRGSVPELVEPGVTGYIARSADEMCALIRPGGVLDEFDRLRCRERAVERFSRERMVSDYERLYRKALERSPITRPRVQVA